MGGAQAGVAHEPDDRVGTGACGGEAQLRPCEGGTRTGGGLARRGWLRLLRECADLTEVNRPTGTWRICGSVALDLNY